jgi:homoserine dehydrogenase
VLRYVGVIDLAEVGNANFDKTKVASVGIRHYALDHPFASLQGCDNVIAIYTSRFVSSPFPFHF